MGTTGSLVEEIDGRFKVHRDVYTDPSIFDWEMKELFEQSWTFVCHESLVAEPNDYFTTQVGKQPVLVTRDESGTVHCFLNRCRHRGAKVCRSKEGNSARFRCMYHSWTYKNSGELLNMPDREGYPPDFDMDSLGLLEVPRVENFHGLIFVTFREDGPSLSEHLGPAETYLKRFFDRDVVVSRNAETFSYTVESNWKLQLENTVDAYHVPFVHSTTPIGSLGGNYEFDPTGLAKSVNIGSGHYATTIPLHPKMPEIMKKVLREWSFGSVNGTPLLVQLVIAPNLAILGNWLLIRRLKPQAPDRTEVTYYFFHPRGVDSEEISSLQEYRDDFFGGGAGRGSPDDMVALHICQEGIQAGSSDAPEAPYNDLSKGLHREVERVEEDGLPPYERAGQMTDDAHFRGFFRWWDRRWRNGQSD